MVSLETKISLHWSNSTTKTWSNIVLVSSFSTLKNIICLPQICPYQIYYLSTLHQKTCSMLTIKVINLFKVYMLHCQL